MRASQDAGVGLVALVLTQKKIGCIGGKCKIPEEIFNAVTTDNVLFVLFQVLPVLL